MKPYLVLILSLIMSSFNSFAMDNTEAKSNSSNHAELTNQLTDLLLINGLKLGMDFAREAYKESGLTDAYFDGSWEIGKRILTQPLRELLQALSDGQLSDLVQRHSNPKYSELLKKITNFPFEFEKLKHKAMVGPKSCTRRPDLANDALGKICQALEPGVVQKINIPMIGPMIAHNIVYLFDQNIRKQFPEEVNSMNHVAQTYPNLDPDIKRVIEEHKAQIDKETEELATKFTNLTVNEDDSDEGDSDE